MTQQIEKTKASGQGKRIIMALVLSAVGTMFMAAVARGLGIALGH